MAKFELHSHSWLCGFPSCTRGYQSGDNCKKAHRQECPCYQEKRPDFIRGVMHKTG
jgi:hypothetical protein